MKRLKVILALALALAMMVTVSVAPALANNNDNRLLRKDVQLDRKILHELRDDDNDFNRCCDNDFRFNTFGFNTFNNFGCWEWSWVFERWDWDDDCD